MFHQMLQNEVISELVEYANSIPVPDNVASVETVVEYLQALNNLFELSLLGNHVRIFKLEGSTFQRMEKGFNFFKKWCEDAISQGFVILFINLAINRSFQRWF